jgi:MFS family permease
VRFADRLGKGVRSSPRDAMVADATRASQRGAAYGYHRAMDNAGAILGPLVGFALLRWLHLELRSIFALAAIPGALAVAALVFGVREVVAPARAAAAVQHGDVAMQQRAADSRDLRRYLGVVALFTLGNSADAFLLVRAAQVLHPGAALGAAMLADPEVLLLWTAHNAVKALLSRAGGGLSDRFGRRPLIGAGWLLYALTYLWFAFAHARWEMWILFPLYGVYYALVEGPERALVAELAGEGRRGTAFGWFHGVVGVAALPASLLFGRLYQVHGAVAAFGTSAALAGAAAVGLLFVHARKPGAR